MPSPEHYPESRCLAPLPPELAEFLKDQVWACLTHATDRGTVFVIKAPGEEIKSLRGRIPIELRHELYRHPAAPVIRTVFRFYDQPEHPLALESFINVGDPQQRDDFADLAHQATLKLLFYDEDLQHQLSKRVGHPARRTIKEILDAADRLRSIIPPDQFDFDRAKGEIMQVTIL